LDSRKESAGAERYAHEQSSFVFKHRSRFIAREGDIRANASRTSANRPEWGFAKGAGWGSGAASSRSDETNRTALN
jgi:hypothetical protein